MEKKSRLVQKSENGTETHKMPCESGKRDAGYVTVQVPNGRVAQVIAQCVRMRLGKTSNWMVFALLMVMNMDTSLFSTTLKIIIFLLKMLSQKVRWQRKFSSEYKNRCRN